MSVSPTINPLGPHVSQERLGVTGSVAFKEHRQPRGDGEQTLGPGLLQGAVPAVKADERCPSRHVCRPYGSNQENRVVDIVEATNGTHQWLYNNPDDKGSKGRPYDWTFDAAWHCAEWYVDVSTKSYRFFSDGTEVNRLVS